MRLALQIFWKDTEHLWRAILLSLILLAAFTAANSLGWMARIKADTTHLENLAELALCVVWSFLIAFAIHEDPPTGDRQFWVALPCGWRPLVLGKGMFIAAFIQIPYFLATAVILLTQRFNPFLYLPHLLWKQLVLLTLIVPVAALAAVVKNMAQFCLAAVAVLAGVEFLSNRINLEIGQESAWDVRWSLALAVLFIGALIVATLQFTKRSTIRSRAIGIATLLAASGIFSWLPREASAKIHAAFSPAPGTQGQISVELSPVDPDRSNQHFYRWGATTVVAPITFSGLSADAEVHFDQVSLSLTNAQGDRVEAQFQSVNGPPVRFLASLESRDTGIPRWQILQFADSSVWNRFRRGSVTIHGAAIASFYRSGKPAFLPAGDEKMIPGMGNCASGSVPNGIASEFIVECESSDVADRAIRLELRPTASQLKAIPWLDQGRTRNRLGQFRYPAYYPRSQWLSPLHWGGSPLISGVNSAVDVTLTREIPLGSALVNYTIPNIDLNRYVVDVSELNR